MKICHECIPCLVRQSVEVAELMSNKKELQQKIIKKTLEQLCDITFNETAPYLARHIHKYAKQITGNQDPYKELKIKYNKIAEDLCYELDLPKMVTKSDNPFDTACRLAIAGNIIDFGLGITLKKQGIYDSIKQSLESEIACNSIQELQNAVTKAENILILCDNSGEIVFDKLLVNQMPKHKVTYVVKGAAIVNDATLQDAIDVGMTDLVKVMHNGAEAQGTILELCSEEFIQTFNSADLIICKGQANYETLSDLHDPRIYFLLKAKCQSIADHLNCQKGAYVIKHF